MLDTHQAVPTWASRPAESGDLPQNPNGKSRGKWGPTVWVQYVDPSHPSPGTLLRTPDRTPPGHASHHRGTAQEIRPFYDSLQPCRRDNWMWEHWDNLRHENTFVGGDAYPNERRAVAKASLVSNPWGCTAGRTGCEGEIVDRLRTVRSPGIWNSGGLESDCVGSKGVGWDGHGGWAEVYGREEESRGKHG